MTIVDGIIYFFQKLACFTTKICFGLETQGRENLALLGKKQCLIIANHRTRLDPFYISAAIPFANFLKMDLRYMAYHKFCKIFPFILLMGAYPIYQGTGSLEKALASTEELIKKGKNILIFPEGKMALDNDPVPARPGIAYLAKKYNLPIVPIALKNVFGTKLIDFVLRRKKIIAEIGPPFYYSDVSNDMDDNYQMAGKIMEKVNIML